MINNKLLPAQILSLLIIPLALSNAYSKPIEMYCIGLFANGNPLKTLLLIDESENVVYFDPTMKDKSSFKSVDMFSFEWEIKQQNARFLSVLNRFSGELVSLKQLQEETPELHFKADCYPADARKL